MLYIQNGPKVWWCCYQCSRSLLNRAGRGPRRYSFLPLSDSVSSLGRPPTSAQTKIFPAAPSRNLSSPATDSDATGISLIVCVLFAKMRDASPDRGMDSAGPRGEMRASETRDGGHDPTYQDCSRQEWGQYGRERDGSVTKSRAIVARPRKLR